MRTTARRTPTRTCTRIRKTEAPGGGARRHEARVRRTSLRRGDPEGEFAAQPRQYARVFRPLSLSDTNAVGDRAHGYDGKRQRTQNEPTRVVCEIERPTKMGAFRHPYTRILLIEIENDKSPR